MIEKFTNGTELVLDDPFPHRFDLGLSISHCCSARERERGRENNCKNKMNQVHGDRGSRFI